MQIKNTKKTIFLITMLMAMLVLFSSSVYAENQTVYTQGTLHYTVEDESATITEYFGADETAEIPASIAGIPVNAIAKGAFTGNTNVKEVILPDTITAIEEGAFDTYITVMQKQGGNGGSSDSQEAEEAVNSGSDQSQSGMENDDSGSQTDSKNTESNSKSTESKSTESVGTVTNNSGKDNAAKKNSKIGNTAEKESMIIIQKGSSSSANMTENSNAASSVSETEESSITDASASSEAEMSSSDGAVDETDVDIDAENFHENNTAFSPRYVVVIIIVIVIALAAAAVVIKKKRKN